MTDCSGWAFDSFSRFLQLCSSPQSVFGMKWSNTAFEIMINNDCVQCVYSPNLAAFSSPQQQVNVMWKRKETAILNVGTSVVLWYLCNYNKWLQDNIAFTVKYILSTCALEASHFMLYDFIMGTEILHF